MKFIKDQDLNFGVGILCTLVFILSVIQQDVFFSILNYVLAVINFSCYLNTKRQDRRKNKNV